MTEAEWLACEEPDKLLKRVRFRSYRRKSRLFAVACCRRIWNLFVDERSQVAVEVAERHADGPATDEELQSAAKAAKQAHKELFNVLGKQGSCIEWAAAFVAEANPLFAATRTTWAAEYPRSYEVRRPRPNDFDEIQVFPCNVTKRTLPLSLVLGSWQVQQTEEWVATGATRPVQAALIRCIFGNPFRPVVFDACLRGWKDGTLPKLAQGIYDQQSLPEGSLDATRLAILADALEEAGCTDADMLNHCRQPGEHVRGCWVVDLVLGRE